MKTESDANCLIDRTPSRHRAAGGKCDSKNRLAGRSGERPLFVSRRVRSQAAFGSPTTSRESYRDGLPMSNLWSRMTVAESNGPPAPVGSLRLEAGTHATSGNEIIGSGESARRTGDRGRTTCGRVTVAVKKSGNHEGHEEHEGTRRCRFDGCRVTSRVRRIGRRTLVVTRPARMILHPKALGSRARVHHLVLTAIVWEWIEVQLRASIPCHPD